MVRTLNLEKRNRLIKAALKLFVENGVSNTSTAEIAKAAGMAAGTLFLYFPTKQALLDELILKIGEEQSAQVNQLLEPSLSVRETFYTIWHATVHWFLENMDAYLYLQQVRDTGMISPPAVQESAKFFGYYYTAIQKGRDDHALKPFPLDLIGDFLYQDIVAVMNTLRAHPDVGQREEIIAQGFNIFWDGIRAGAHPERG